MSSFIRPEARDAMWRWREVIGGTVLAAVGLIWALGPGGLLGILGWIASAAGLSLALMGVQRGRFRGRSGGPGMVDVDEGQVIYFGPLTGGSVALRDLEEVALIRSGQSPHWRLSTQDGALHIPVNAEGTDALFEAFTVLPGLKVERMLRALNDPGAQDIVIWGPGSTRPSTLRLH